MTECVLCFSRFFPSLLIQVNVHPAIHPNLSKYTTLEHSAWFTLLAFRSNLYPLSYLHFTVAIGALHYYSVSLHQWSWITHRLTIGTVAPSPLCFFAIYTTHRVTYEAGCCHLKVLSTGPHGNAAYCTSDAPWSSH